jgi:hypothetical protein
MPVSSPGPHISLSYVAPATLLRSPRAFMPQPDSDQVRWSLDTPAGFTAAARSCRIADVAQAHTHAQRGIFHRRTPDICRRLYGSRAYPRADLPDMARIRPKNPIPLVLRRCCPARPISDGCDRVCLAGRSTPDTTPGARTSRRPSRRDRRWGLLAAYARICRPGTIVTPGPSLRSSSHRPGKPLRRRDFARPLILDDSILSFGRGCGILDAWLVRGRDHDRGARTTAPAVRLPASRTRKSSRRTSPS